MMKRFIAGAAALALILNGTVAQAQFREECRALAAEIRKAQQSINAIDRYGRSGSWLPFDSPIRDAQLAEDQARDEMVRTGCNKRVNASRPECQAIIVRVAQLRAHKQAVEAQERQRLAQGAVARHQELAARYAAECTGRMERADPRRPIQPQPTLTPEQAAIGATVIMGIIGLGLGAAAAGRAGGGHVPMAPMGPHRR